MTIMIFFLTGMLISVSVLTGILWWKVNELEKDITNLELDMKELVDYIKKVIPQ